VKLNRMKDWGARLAGRFALLMAVMMVFIGAFGERALPSAEAQATMQTNTIVAASQAEVGFGPSYAAVLMLTNSQGVTFTNALALAGSSQISVQIVDSNNATGAQTNIVTVDRSDNGSVWQTGTFSFTCVGQGSITAATVMTNVTIGGDAFWRLTVSNTMAAASDTNYVAVYISKKPNL
jgi:hypothetical protein